MNEKQERVAKLGKDLDSKFAQLKSLYHHPRLFLTEFFYDLRNEIDYAAEKQLSLLTHQETTVANEINQTRMMLIQELTKHENTALEKLTAPRGEEDMTKFETFEQRISKFNPEHTKPDLSEFEDEYEELVIDLLDEVKERERQLLSNQTFIYFPSTGEWRKSCGLLVHLPDDFLTRVEIQALR